jgi:hypothetical protein
MMRVVTASCLLLSSLAMSTCARTEDPARVQMRERLQQEARLSEEELARLCTAVARIVEGKSFRIKDSEAARELSPEQHDAVFGLLSNRAGLYDEGLRRDGGITYRVLNAPGRSNNAEIEATQRLWIDVATLLPLRYQFTYAFPGYGDYAYELILNR